MGGMVAQELALSPPAAMATLTLGCTTAGGTQSRPDLAGGRVRAHAAALSGDRERILRTGFEFVVSRRLRRQRAQLLRVRRGGHISFRPRSRCSVPAQGGHRARRVRALARTERAHARHPRHGRPDARRGQRRAPRLAVPGARLELLDGVGHLFFWEQPSARHSSSASTPPGTGRRSPLLRRGATGWRRFA